MYTYMRVHIFMYVAICTYVRMHALCKFAGPQPRVCPRIWHGTTCFEIAFERNPKEPPFLRNCVEFLNISLTRGGAVKEPWDTWVCCCFTLGLAFLCLFSCTPFSAYNHICHHIGSIILSKSTPNPT
mgnify:CR=1 FL=1